MAPTPLPNVAEAIHEALVGGIESLDPPHCLTQGFEGTICPIPNSARESCTVTTPSADSDEG